MRKVFAPDRASSPKQTRNLRGLEHHVLLTLGRNREEEGAPLQLLRDAAITALIECVEHERVLLSIVKITAVAGSSVSPSSRSQKVRRRSGLQRTSMSMG